MTSAPRSARSIAQYGPSHELRDVQDAKAFKSVWRSRITLWITHCQGSVAQGSGYGRMTND